jgi:sporadic carbohydrate cluster 2OG-Fe(II) oxygenase
MYYGDEMFVEEGKYEDLYTKGYCTVDVPDMAPIDELRDIMIRTATEASGLQCDDPEEFLNNIHKNMNVDKDLNPMRLKIMTEFNRGDRCRKLIYKAFKPIMDEIIGPDVAAQKRINLVVQPPQNTEEVTPMHSDVEGGDSPFEITIWLPFVSVFSTKSMFCFDRSKGGSILKAVEDSGEKDLLALTNKWLTPESFVDIKYGQAFLFNPFLLHGNTVNETDESRWSINWRLKSIFSPYSAKDFGEYFEVINMSPQTKIGIEYYDKEFIPPK